MHYWLKWFYSVILLTQANWVHVSNMHSVSIANWSLIWTTHTRQFQSCHTKMARSAPFWCPSFLIMSIITVAYFSQFLDTDIKFQMSHSANPCEDTLYYQNIALGGENVKYCPTVPWHCKYTVLLVFSLLSRGHSVLLKVWKTCDTNVVCCYCFSSVHMKDSVCNSWKT